MADRPITEAQLRKRVKAATQGAQDAKLQVLGVEVGECGKIRLTTAPEGVDVPLPIVRDQEPDALDKWADNNVVPLETRS